MLEGWLDRDCETQNILTGESLLSHLEKDSSDDMPRAVYPHSQVRTSNTQGCESYYF